MRGVVGVAAGVLVDSGVAVSSGVGVKVGRGVNVGRGVRVGVVPPSEIKVPASQASPANTTSIATKNKNSRLIFKSETPFRARQVPPRDASAKCGIENYYTLERGAWQIAKFCRIDLPSILC